MCHVTFGESKKIIKSTNDLLSKAVMDSFQTISKPGHQLCFKMWNERFSDWVDVKSPWAIPEKAKLKAYLKKCSAGHSAEYGPLSSSSNILYGGYEDQRLNCVLAKQDSVHATSPPVLPSGSLVAKEPVGATSQPVLPSGSLVAPDPFRVTSTPLLPSGCRSHDMQPVLNKKPPWPFPFVVPDMPASLTEMSAPLGKKATRIVVERMFFTMSAYNMYPSPHHYNEAASALLQKYPQWIPNYPGLSPMDFWKRKLCDKFRNERKRHYPEGPVTPKKKRRRKDVQPLISVFLDGEDEASLQHHKESHFEVPYVAYDESGLQPEPSDNIEHCMYFEEVNYAEDALLESTSPSTRQQDTENNNSVSLTSHSNAILPIKLVEVYDSESEQSMDALGRIIKQEVHIEEEDDNTVEEVDDNTSHINNHHENIALRTDTRGSMSPTISISIDNSPTFVKSIKEFENSQQDTENRNSVSLTSHSNAILPMKLVEEFDSESEQHMDVLRRIIKQEVHVEEGGDNTVEKQDDNTIEEQDDNAVEEEDDNTSHINNHHENIALRTNTRDSMSPTTSISTDNSHTFVKLIDFKNGSKKLFDMLQNIVKEDDDVDAFFRSIALTVKKFPRNLISTAKLKVLSVITDLEQSL